MNGGIYYFDKKIFKYLSAKRLSLENDIIHKLILEKIVEWIISKKNLLILEHQKKLIFF